MDSREGATPANRGLGALLQSLKLDLVAAWLHLVRNIIGGSHFVPRVGRFVVYRLAGLEFHTPDVAAGQRIYNRNIRVGRQSVVGRACVFEGGGPIEIGEYTMVGPEVYFVTSHHDIGGPQASREITSRPVVVGDRVWIGTRCTLLPGTVVGDGCVLAAGSVVTGRCDPGYLYGGVPARRIRPVDARVADLASVASEPVVPEAG